MKATLVLLAVTVMKTGVCIAGVRREAPETWVRPVREFGTVLLGDITYPTSPGSGSERRVMRPFDIVELALGRARPDPPHVEDWTCDFAHSRPRLLATLAEREREQVLAAASAESDAIWMGNNRSLGTLCVDDLSATFTADTYAGTYEARVVFPGLPSGVASVPCTDLKWRALGRRLLAQGQVAASQGTTRVLRLGGDELRAALGGPAGIWLALGLTRARDGRHWPLVVGVHTVPEYEADVDYHAL
ncbi:MAG TPA: hypothetical protein VE258_10755 [Ktedonobacterales bacterium]|nr:hypothetical protein [Ktedonobacterales bacterium]